MIDTIQITRTNESRLKDVDFDNLVFGKVFADHMVDMTYKNGAWGEPKIRPYGPISIHPSMHVLHYGQAIFEGMKAYYVDENTIHLFRLEDHYRRISNSSRRMSIPEMEKEVFIESIKELVRLDHGWVPKKRGHSLYLRPFLFASQEYIGARAADEYRFMVITSPVAAYYKEGFNPVSLTTTDKYVRAVKGGTGFAKAAGNYAGSFYPARQAQEAGYTQILWLDAMEHRYIEEVGTMNIFFLMDDVLVTPPLAGTVLPGITRSSVLALAEEWGVDTEERRISIDEVFDAHKAGHLKEVFGSGTAAVISPVGLIHHNGKTIELDQEHIGPFAKKMFDSITGIQYGEREDPFGWVHPIHIS
ncbi:MAG: branched-chain amino acid aminotransferase [Balneolaceae bacterium]